MEQSASHSKQNSQPTLRERRNRFDHIKANMSQSAADRVPSNVGGKLLSPNWILVKKFQAVFEEDPKLNVENATGDHIMIVVDDERKGNALRALLPERYDPGAGPIDVYVRTSEGKEWPANKVGTIDQLVDTLRAAFGGNRLFVQAMELPPPMPSDIKFAGLVMTKSVVQFFNDDLSEVYRNYNGVTANVTRELIKESYCDGTLFVSMGTRPEIDASQ